MFFKMGAFVLSFLPFIISNRYRPSVLFCMFFFVILLFDIIKDFFVPSVLYVAGGAIMAKFVLKRKFNLYMIYATFLLMWTCFFRAGISESLDSVLVASENFVSAFLLFNAVCVTVITYRQNNEIILFPSILCLIVSLMATGRTGIISSFIFLLGLIILKIQHVRKRFFRRAIYIFIVISLLSSVSTILMIYENSEALARIRNRGFQDGARETIISNYLSNMDFTRIMIGYNYNENNVIHSYGDNPHNSFIKAHAHLGFMFFVFLFYIGRSFFIYLNRKEYIYILSIIVLLIRGSTDIIFLNHFDFVVYMLVFPAYIAVLKQNDKQPCSVKM